VFANAYVVLTNHTQFTDHIFMSVLYG